MNTRDTLRAMGVHNTYEILKRFAGDPKKAIALDYHRAGDRDPWPDGTKVWSPNFKVDPNSHWRAYGGKWFSGSLQNSMVEALAWARETFGIKEWAPCPFSGRTCKIPKSIREAALKAVKEYRP